MMRGSDKSAQPDRSANRRRGVDSAGTYYEFGNFRKDSLDGSVVLIHGVGLDHAMWDAQFDYLERHHPVLRYDLLGHGRTPHDPQTDTLEHYVTQLTELLDELGIGKIHLVGYSVGGLVAQRFALTELNRLISVTFMNSVYRRRPDELVDVTARLSLTREKGAAATAPAAIERWFNPDFIRANPFLMEQIRTRLLSTNLDGYVTAYDCFVHGDREIGDGLKTVSCPALAITGENDVGSTPEMCYRMMEDLPDARVHIVCGAKHGAPQEAAGEVNQVLLEFFAEANAAPR